VLRGIFHRRGPLQQLLFCDIVGRNHFSQFGLAPCDSAGFIKHHHLDVFEGLNSLAGANQNASLGPNTRAHHQRGRRCQAQSAGAGDNQNRNGGENSQYWGGRRLINPGQKIRAPCKYGAQAVGGNKPHRKACQGNQNDDGHKTPRHAVGEFLNGHSRALGLFYQFDHLGQKGIAAHLGGLDP